MKLVFTISAVSLIVMIVVDFVIGSEAEFLNAFSVLERLLGRQPTAGESVVAKQFGAWGELCIVLMVNLAIGGLLAAVVRLFMRQ